MIRPPAYSDMLQNYYGELFMRLRRERQSRLASVDSPQKARHYVSQVRQSIRGAFDLPGERTPLYARGHGLRGGGRGADRGGAL